MSFIADFEWFRKCAYRDGSSRYSIWYGTKSYPWECITENEAIKRKLYYIKPLIDAIPSCFTDNQKIAIVSYQYNTGWWQMNLRNHIKNCDKKRVLYIMNVYWHSADTDGNWKIDISNKWGRDERTILSPRRNIEINKFNTP